MYIHNTILSIRKLILPHMPHPAPFLKWNLGIEPFNLYRLENEEHPVDNQTVLTAAHCSEKHLC
jgi:hypothetical protein